MSSILIVGLTLGITILAFVIKNGMLYAASIIFWTISGFVLANLTWPAGNTYLVYASILVCLSMVIVMTVTTLMYYINWNKGRRTYAPTDEEEQASYRKQVYKITRKKKDMWD